MQLRILSLLLGLTIVLGLFSCVNHANTDGELPPLSKTDFQNNLRILLLTPDSLLSVEDNQLLQQLEAIMYEHCVIENERFQLKISKHEWRKLGVREEYYEMLGEEIKSLNNFLDTTSFSKHLILDSYRDAHRKYEKKQQE